MKATAEYISKDQVLKIIDNVEVVTSYWAITIDGYVTPKPDTFERLHTEINNLIPADVVEVVRCKDCVYKIGNIDSAVRNSYDFFCLRFNSYVLGDGYCDFGEREDGGESDD